jgi:hypothetical protein
LKHELAHPKSLPNKNVHVQMNIEANGYITSLVCLMLYSGPHLVYYSAASFNNFVVYTPLSMGGTWKCSTNNDWATKKSSKKPMEL